ncbi:MAG: pyrimidine/purine nucleoside phosphorylase [Gammaproteobacteria bacterium]|nr:pyrimidine/purine nucleoside phosphorylase [Gammaproteobacteria bacterium]
MSQFDNVSVIKAANLYFDGKVSSRTVVLTDGSRLTLGVALPGEYSFNTDKAERMEIQAGELDLQLPSSDAWQTIRAGESFEVPAKSQFRMNVKTPVDYCCHFLG